MSTPDLSEFKQLSSGKPDLCPMGKILAGDKINDEEKAALTAALDDRTITNTAIVEWLERREIRVHYNVPAYHRNGRCKCRPQTDG